jgi:hypothetical protein
MTSKIDWAMNLQVSGGPKFIMSDILIVQAYDMIEVTIPKGDNKIVNLQPNEIDHVVFLLIKAADKSMYSDLNYQPEGAAKSLALNAPVMLFGSAITLLASAAKITFSNTSTSNDAVISILVGRNAIV